MNLTKTLLAIIAVTVVATATIATQHGASDIQVTGPDGDILTDNDYEEAASMKTETGAKMRTIQLLNSLERAEATGAQVVERYDDTSLETILEDISDLRSQVEQRVNQSNYLNANEYLWFKRRARSLTSSFKERSASLTSDDEKREIREEAISTYREETREERRRLRSLQQRFGQQRVQAVMSQAGIDVEIDEETTLGELRRIIQRNKDEANLGVRLKEQRVENRIELRRQANTGTATQRGKTRSTLYPTQEESSSESSCDFTGSRFTCLDDSVTVSSESVTPPTPSEKPTPAKTQPRNPTVTFDLRNDEDTVTTITEVSLKGRAGRVTCDPEAGPASEMNAVEPGDKASITCDLSASFLNTAISGEVTYAPTVNAADNAAKTTDELTLFADKDDADNGGGNDSIRTTSCETSDSALRCGKVTGDGHTLIATLSYDGDGQINFETASATSNLVNNYDCQATIGDMPGASKTYRVACQPDGPAPTAIPTFIEGNARFKETTSNGDLTAKTINATFTSGEGSTKPGDDVELACGDIVGDADGDGVITEEDAELVNQVAVGTLDAPAQCCLDVNQDGDITSYDASLIEQHVEGNTDSRVGEPCSSTGPVDDVVRVTPLDRPVEPGDAVHVHWFLPAEQIGSERLITLESTGTDETYTLQQGGSLNADGEERASNEITTEIPSSLGVDEPTDFRITVQPLRTTRADVPRWSSDEFTVEPKMQGENGAANESGSTTLFLPDLKQGAPAEVSWEVPAEYRDNLRMAKLVPTGSDAGFTVLQDEATLADGTPYSSRGHAEITVPQAAPPGDYRFVLGTQPWSTGPTWSETVEVDASDEDGPDRASIAVNWYNATEAESAFLKEGESVLLADEKLTLELVGESQVVVSLNDSTQVVDVDETNRIIGENAEYTVTLNGVI